MVRRKDPEITTYKLKDGKTYFRLRTYIGTDPETGKAVKRTVSRLKSRKEAEAVRNKLKAEGITKKIDTKMTVSEVFEIWLKSVELDVRPSTIKRIKDTWKNHTEPEFGDNYINKISPDHIQRYVNNLASKYVTYKSQANQLHRLIKYAIFRHWCDRDPFDFVLIPKKSLKAKRDTSHNFYERDELKRFLEVAKEYSPMKYTYFLTVASLGCRRGEALALKWTDIDFDNKVVRIERTVSKDDKGNKVINDVKNGIHHTVPMSDSLFKVLTDYKTHTTKIGDTCEWLFHQSDYTFCWSQQVDLWIKYLYKYDEKSVTKWNKEHPDNKKKPLRRITPHGLRHTLATLLYDGNSKIKPKDVQYILGHRTSKTAMEIYTHVTKQQKKDIRSSINKLDF